MLELDTPLSKRRLKLHMAILAIEIVSLLAIVLTIEKTFTVYKT